MRVQTYQNKMKSISKRTKDIFQKINVSKDILKDWWKIPNRLGTFPIDVDDRNSNE